MAYRVQNHAFDLVLPVTNDALLIIVDTNQRATCTHVPRQILKEELQKLLPSSWITNYEKLHQNSVPIQSMEPEFTKKTDGTPVHDPFPMPIESFSDAGLPIYSFAEDNHVFWDTCHCDGCCNEVMADEDDTPKHKKKSYGTKLKSRYNHGDNTINTLGQPFGKFDYLVDMVQTNLKKMTVSVDSRILHLEKLCAEIQQRISTIHEYLLLQASTGRHIDPLKEQEIQSLKIQLKSLQTELAKSKSKPLSFPEPS
ncbi:movement protein [Salix suchowensis]|nr:movement protein [Salix suchowensis]